MEADGRTAPLRSILIFLHRCLFCPHNLGQYICGRDTCQEAGHLLKSICKQFHISLSDLPHISQSYGVPRGRIVCRKEYSVRMRKKQEQRIEPLQRLQPKPPSSRLIFERKEGRPFSLFLVSARTPDSGRGKGGSWLCILSKEQALVPRHIQYRDFLKISLTFVQM